MTSDSWEKAKRIFAEARKLAPELRSPFLDEVCADDAETRREVESLLAFHDATGFLEKPALGEVAEVVYRARNVGRRFGHYEIIEQIGAGGMGEVYLAEDKKLDRKVAIKILNDKFAQHESNLSRFIQEAKAASALNHPNILVIHEVGEDENTYYIVSEYIEGETLSEILRERTLEISEILDISIQIVNALRAAHEANLVHRDIKPDNVMRRADGIVKILDFGLAKLIEPKTGDFEPLITNQNQTAKGIILGTVSYMSPEQARGEKLDARSDIFSFGCVLYEMLTGQRAFRGETISHTIISILEKEPPPVSQFHRDFPDEIERIVKNCLKKNLTERYAAAKDLLADIKTLKKRLEFETEFKNAPSTPNQRTFVETQSLKVDVTIEAPSLSPHNLVENLAPIIGREKEISEIKNLLRQADVRLLTLTGVGGAGKTRLALAVARDLLPDFPDGVFFIELSSVTDAEIVVSAIAQPLGVKEAGGKPLLEILKDFLRDKKMLLVIDNFEQVADAAPQIRELLFASRLKILITSRTVLHLNAEHEFVVPPLAVPSEIRNVSLETLTAYDAVKLFVQRAQKAKSAFVLTNENAGSVAEICTRLDGLPLAIELAAARVKIFAPQAILTKLANRLHLLTGGARDLPLRQQTMRGTVEWSYGLLSEDEKGLFRRLSVFVGGFTYEAAEAVCCDSEPFKEQIDFLDLLTSLVDKSLLITKEQIDSEETRFRMLEVVREYALELLDAGGEKNPLCRGHSEYFLALAKEAEPHLQGEGGKFWLNRFEEEHDNFRAALNWSLENDIQTAAQLADALRLFWNFHGYLTEGRQWFERVLESNCDIFPTARQKILFGLGLMSTLQGDYNSALKFLEQSRNVAIESGNRQQFGITNNVLANVLVEFGDLTRAKALSREALAIGIELNDKNVIARSFLSLGEMARSEDDYPEARRLYEEALEFFEQADMQSGLAASFINLGMVAYLQGDFKMSRFYLKNALKTSHEAGLKVLTFLSFDGFAALAAKDDKLELAANLAGAADGLRESVSYILEHQDRRFHDVYLGDLKSKIDKADFSKFYEQGRKLKLEEVIRLITDSEQLTYSH